ncbi:MAG: DNA repair protein RadA [Patescibacteria group bacterium]
MKNKNKTIFNCEKCGAQYDKWIGRCLECGTWGSVKEEILETKNENRQNVYKAGAVKKISEIAPEDTKRIETKISELDRVLGGGLIPSSLILLGGEPGVGKSTLAIQTAVSIPSSLYISAEESIGQIKIRADRLKLNSANLKLSNETCVEKICATIEQEKPILAIIDSIQTIYSEETIGEAGNINQIKACAVKLLEIAKKNKTSIIVIGHVTKDGNVAGPKTLEHLVDTVIYLEGERNHNYRILRTVKNRFGATDEIGIFDMAETGLKSVINPSANFLEDREDEMSGSVITCLMEGTRPLLVEVQSLVNKTVFGYPVRKSSGFDLNRLHVLTAVLQKRTGINLSQYDIHINIAGGIKANEPAADLAVCLAIASSFKDKKLSKNLAVFGEVGLGGEVRKINFLEKRIKECENLGIKTIITGKSENKTKKIKIIEVKNITELVKHT